MSSGLIHSCGSRSDHDVAMHRWTAELCAVCNHSESLTQFGDIRLVECRAESVNVRHDWHSKRRISPNSTCCVTSRHDTTRYRAHEFWNRKKSWRAVSRLSDSMARHARHDKRDSHGTCSGASPERVWWTCQPHVSRSCSWDWCKSRAQD